jgi:predicted nucleic acid-binding protein
VILYLDTSSLVKLYVVESGSDAVRALVEGAAMVATSDVAYPETRAALARRRRERALQPRAFRTAKEAFENDWSRYFAIGVTAPLCREAGELAERYRLRGFDSIHLASFAEVARQRGVGDIRFSSSDAGLNRAARSLRRVLLRRANRT